MHGALGLGLVVAMIAFAFGEHAARIFVGTILAVGALGFLYIAVLVVTGSI